MKYFISILILISIFSVSMVITDTAAWVNNDEQPQQHEEKIERSIASVSNS